MILLLLRGCRLLVFVTIFLLTAVNPYSAKADDDALLLKDADFAPERITLLIKSLSDADTGNKLSAIEALSQLGPEARPAVPKLIELLADDSRHSPFAGIHITVCDDVARRLEQIGAESVQPLAKTFAQAPETVQERIAFAARLMGPRARALVPLLVQKCLDPEIDHAPFVSELAAIDPTGKSAIPVLVKILRKDKNERAREFAAKSLSRSDDLPLVYWKEQSPGARWFRSSRERLDVVGEALINALDDPAPQVRATAAITLSSYPEFAFRAAPRLVKLLEDEAEFSVNHSNHVGGGLPVSSAASRALSELHSEADNILTRIDQSKSRTESCAALAIAKLAPFSKQPLSHLTRLLNGEFCDYAFAPLARMGADALPAIPQLKSFSKHESEDVVATSQMAIACIDPKRNPDSVKFLKQHIESSTTDASYFLRKVGVRDEFPIPALIKVLHSKQDGKLDVAVLRVLAGIGPAARSAAPRVIGDLDTTFRFDVDEIEEALFKFGPEVIPLLIQELRTMDKSVQSRVSCLHVLSRLGPRSAEAIPEIMSQSDSKYPRVREAVAKTLGMVASRPVESLAVLQRLLNDPRPFVRAAATDACSAFGKAAKPIVPNLSRQLSDSYIDVRIAAAVALGRLGPVAKDAIPQLTPLANAEDVLLRETVQDALRAIQLSVIK